MKGAMKLLESFNIWWYGKPKSCCKKKSKKKSK